MKKFLFFCLTVILFVSCSDEIPAVHSTAEKSSGRTLIAYLVANNNLDDELMDNVKWMYEGMIQMKDSCTLLMYYRPSGSNFDITSPRILKYLYDGDKINGQTPLDIAEITIENIVAQGEVMKEYDRNQVSTNPNEMRRVFTDLKEMASTTHYGVIFGSHATSWLPADRTSRSFGDDGRVQINIPEMSAVMEEVFNASSLDFMIWDACMMGTAEVCYQFRNVSRYMIASVMESSKYGFPYHLLMSDLYADNLDLKSICQKYIDFYEMKKLWGTIAAFDCSKVEPLAQLMKNNITNINNGLRLLNKQNIQQYGAHGFEYFAFDVVDVFRQLNGGKVPDEINKVMNELVLAKNCLGGTEHEYEGVILEAERFCGMGMYLPNVHVNDTWNRYYASHVAWYEAAGWNEVLN